MIHLSRFTFVIKYATQWLAMHCHHKLNLYKEGILKTKLIKLSLAEEELEIYTQKDEIHVKHVVMAVIRTQQNKIDQSYFD